MAPPFDHSEPEECRPPSASRRQQEPEPTPAQITLAKQFLVKALESGPRLTREVEQEAKLAGIAKRTLDRARRDLHVQRLPPNTFRGPWRMALKDDPAVAAYKQRKEAKNQKARERQGNGRRRKRTGAAGSRAISCSPQFTKYAGASYQLAPAYCSVWVPSDTQASLPVTGFSPQL